MLGILVVLVLSWVLLRYTVHEPLGVLGFRPTRPRLMEFLVGLLFMALIAVINFTGQAHFKETSYVLNPDMTGLQLLDGSFMILRGVLFEELLFRGAVLYLLIRYLGVVKACLISSVVFGVYHWFSYELFGARVILMAYVFLVTGAGGWMFAYAYAKTKSLYAPTGLHLGWNLLTAVVFSAGPLGNQLLIEEGTAVVTSEWLNLVWFTLQAMVAPGLVTWYLHRRYRSDAASP